MLTLVPLNLTQPQHLKTAVCPALWPPWVALRPLKKNLSIPAKANNQCRLMPIQYFLTNVYVQLLQKQPKPQPAPKAKKLAHGNVTQAHKNAHFQHLAETKAQKKWGKQDRTQSNATPFVVAIKQAREGQHITQYHARSSPPLVVEDRDVELDEADGDSDAHNKSKSAIMFKTIILTKLEQTLMVRKKGEGQN